MTRPRLKIENLKVKVEDSIILHNVNLEASPGELHAIMGPNGSGKTTLANTIAGRPGYDVVEGKIILDGEDITRLEPEERSLKGVFLGFQEPPPLPGVRLATLITAAKNKRMGSESITVAKDPKIYAELIQTLRRVGIPPSYASRELHVGFSGGEKKRVELAQALLLKPKLVILDEPDSGLDVDGVKLIAKIIDELRKSGSTVLVITHYARLFHHVEPNRVTVLYKGRVAVSDGPDLAHKIDEEGYEWLSSNDA